MNKLRSLLVMLSASSRCDCSTCRHKPPFSKTSSRPPPRCLGASAASPAPSRPALSRTCYRCGSDRHLANAQSCPAASAKCKACNKTGHFAKVCRSTPTHFVREIELPEVQILFLSEHTAPSKIQCVVTVKTATASVPVELTVDSGFSVSILTCSLYEKHFLGK